MTTYIDANAVNLLSPEFLVNPYPTYEWLRTNSPIHRLTSEHGPKGFVITRYEHVAAMLKDARFEKRIATPENRLPIEMLVTMQKNMMLFMNPPDHTRLRALVNRAFTPRMVQTLQSYIEETAHYLLDGVQTAGTMDLIQDYAFPLPVMVMARMLGVPSEDRQQFRTWTNTLLHAIDLTRSDKELRQGGEVALEFVGYVRTLIHERRQCPQDDLISALVHAQEQEDKLSEQELVATCILLIIAGHETTVNLIGNGIFALLQYPEQLNRLRQDPLLVKSAVEEFLRYESPTQMTVRLATEDVTIDGRMIHAGDQVNLFLAAANRDPLQFPNADTLDITRSPNHHLAFGSGIHFCLGAPLARLEAEIAVNTLLHRVPNLKLNGEMPEWRRLIGFRGLKQLDVSVFISS